MTKEMLYRLIPQGMNFLAPGVPRSQPGHRAQRPESQQTQPCRLQTCSEPQFPPFQMGGNSCPALGLSP